MKKKNIIFDFDGVILDSNHVKTNAFYNLYLDYGKDIANSVKKFHLSNLGLSRYDKFKHYSKNILKSDITDKEIEILDKKFNLYVNSEILKCKFINGWQKV